MDGGTELAIYKEMVKRGGIASWQQVKTALVDEQGVNPVTFGVILKNRCWMDQPGYGVYALRGYRLLIEHVRVRSRSIAIPWAGSQGETSEPRPSLFNADGCVQFTVRMTASTKPHRVINLPERLSNNDDLVGQYRQVSGGYEIWVGRTQISRLPEVLAAAGVQAGEEIRLWLDPKKKAFKWERAEDGDVHQRHHD